MHYLFIDESGDLGEKGSSHFIMAGLSVDTPQQLNHIVKRVRERLNRKLRELPELKANNTSDLVRKSVLARLATIPCEIHLLVIEKEALIPDPFNGYTEALQILIQCARPREIIVDSRGGALAKHLAKALTSSHIVQLNSRQQAGLQITDFIAWSAFQNWESGNGAYLKLFQSKIRSRIEISSGPRGRV
jgi:hypothetical protein